jgi:hypothetical protein
MAPPSSSSSIFCFITEQSTAQIVGSPPALVKRRKHMFQRMKEF